MSKRKTMTQTEYEVRKYGAMLKLEDKCFDNLRKVIGAISKLQVSISELRGPDNLPKNRDLLDKLANDYLGQAQYLIEGPRNDEVDASQAYA
jgi:hypothetical protein